MDYAPTTTALITSDCDAMRFPEHQTAPIASGCAPVQGAGFEERQVRQVQAWKHYTDANDLMAELLGV